ncbi:MAG: DUF2339 domain-containing protein [Prevotellaceae bacterium]|nr:DUF2339 domain-containing protein [Prevotellaceae bacterium]
MFSKLEKLSDKVDRISNGRQILSETDSAKPVAAETSTPIAEEVSAPVIEETTDDIQSQVSVPKRRRINYEKYIGENLFGKIGILVFVIGVGFFVKYAIDHNWINELLRTILGFLIGVGLLVIAQRLEKKYRTFSSLLAGGAFAVFYLTVTIAYHYYHLLSSVVSFIILVATTLFMSILSLLYDRRELATTALIGGFIAPFIASSGEGNYLVLFTYVSILNIGMFVLSIRKRWSELPIIAFAATWLILGLYLLIYGTVTMGVLSFTTLFYFIFLLPILSILKSLTVKVGRVLLLAVVTNNFLYLGVGTYSLHRLYPAIHLDGLLCMFIAVVNVLLVVWLRHSKQNYKFLIYAMLGLALTFVSIAVPIQFDGSLVTLFWASEMVLLLWLYLKSRIRVYEKSTVVLALLTLISFMIDLSDFLQADTAHYTLFVNRIFVTKLYVGLAAGVFALLMERSKLFFQSARLLCYHPWNGAMLLTSVVILYYAFVSEFYIHLKDSSGATLLFTTVVLMALCYGFRHRFPIKSYTAPYTMSIAIGVALYALIIFYTILIGRFSPLPLLIRWLATAGMILHLVQVARRYYTAMGQCVRFTVYLTLVGTLFWLVMVYFFVAQLDIDSYSASFSIAMSLAGFVQMTLGMRLHQKALRIFSLVVFGMVLFKLVVVDLWAMPAIGKIAVFILLGAILLVLSFLYQRLKHVLFKDDETDHFA